MPASEAAAALPDQRAHFDALRERCSLALGDVPQWTVLRHADGHVLQLGRHGGCKQRLRVDFPQPQPLLEVHRRDARQRHVLAVDVATERARHLRRRGPEINHALQVRVPAAVQFGLEHRAQVGVGADGIVETVDEHGDRCAIQGK